MIDKYDLQVGSLVIAKQNTGVCEVGERGVCYEEYRLGNRPGWSFIFERGRYDGFSPDEVDSMLELTGQVCAQVADYEFRNVTRLCQDFRSGRFAPALKAEHKDSDPALAIRGGDFWMANEP